MIKLKNIIIALGLYCAFASAFAAEMNVIFNNKTGLFLDRVQDYKMGHSSWCPQDFKTLTPGKNVTGLCGLVPEDESVWRRVSYQISEPPRMGCILTFYYQYKAKGESPSSCDKILGASVDQLQMQCVVQLEQPSQTNNCVGTVTLDMKSK